MKACLLYAGAMIWLGFCQAFMVPLTKLPPLARLSQDLIAAADTTKETGTEAVATAADAASKATNNPGWLGAPIAFIENGIEVIHEVLEKAGLSNTYGLAIIAFTILVKAITLPLNYQQIESTTKMQAIQPKMKEIQAKYQGDPQLQQKMTQLYQENDVNPLAGCLPALVQIPVFISLYRALTNLAARNELDQAFLWLPSLEGPTYGAGPSEGMHWITKNWNGLEPPLGWPDTLAFLSIPVILIISQFVSQAILQPQNKDDPAAQQSQWILKFLPFMVGYFSLNVPSGLGVYWIVNNIITTLTSFIVRGNITAKMAAAGAGSGVAPPAVPSAKELSRKGFEKVKAPVERVQEVVDEAQSRTEKAEAVPERMEATSGTTPPQQTEGPREVKRIIKPPSNDPRQKRRSKRRKANKASQVEE